MNRDGAMTIIDLPDRTTAGPTAGPALHASMMSLKSSMIKTYAATVAVTDGAGMARALHML